MTTVEILVVQVRLGPNGDTKATFAVCTHHSQPRVTGDPRGRHQQLAAPYAFSTGVHAYAEDVRMDSTWHDDAFLFRRRTALVFSAFGSASLVLLIAVSSQTARRRRVDSCLNGDALPRNQLKFCNLVRDVSLFGKCYMQQLGSTCVQR